jgi:hypothetical protein
MDAGEAAGAEHRVSGAAVRRVREHPPLRRPVLALPRQGSAALIERAAAGRGICPGALTLGTDNGSAFTARAFKLALSGLGITHRRGGYRDPESLGFIESWFAK